MFADFRLRCMCIVSFSVLILITAAPDVEAAKFVSHPPTRPLPQPALRKLESGPKFFVDAIQGDDANAGTEQQPWKSIGHAVRKLEPGDTLCLRGGTYYEHVAVTANGTAKKPVTIRSYPGELAIIDGGLREFFENPAASWQPFADGADGEYRSVKAYPDLGGSPNRTNVLGLFGDSMVPLHGYRYFTDLRCKNEYFANLEAGKSAAGSGVYCGPGVLYDLTTGRIHVRLAHTTQKALGGNNYRGETDPRKVPLVIAGLDAGSPLAIENSKYVRVQDIVVRGARAATVRVSNCANIVFDGVTAYGGSTAMAVGDTVGFRLWNCACRGIAAPWTFRGSLKYRAIEARIFSASGWSPTGIDNRNFEMAYSEFTDCVDGVFIGSVRDVKFHHNLLDNVSDDGIFLTANTAYDGTTHGGNVHIYQNLLSRCLTTFAFGVGHGRQKMTPTGRQSGAGVYIYRNVFDFRGPVYYGQPAADATDIHPWGRIAGDHGGPLWEPMTIYHNTILAYERPFRGYYAVGLGGHMAEGSKRRVFNNIVAQVTGVPGQVLPPIVLPVKKSLVAKSNRPTGKQAGDPLDDLIEGDLNARRKAKKNKPFSKTVNPSELKKLKQQLDRKPPPPLPIDFQADGNLHWSFEAASASDELLQKFRDSADFKSSKHWYPAGWAAHDVVASPRFVVFDANWQAAVNLGLKASSPAIDAGVKLPSEWPDPLRDRDTGKPDIGVLPVDASPWRIGVRGRLSVFGSLVADTSTSQPASTGFPIPANQIPEQPDHKPAVIVQGYPAFDAPLIKFALRRQRVPYDDLRNTWLDPADYHNYPVVVITGDLVRAKIEPNKYDSDDLKTVERYLQDGGTLLLTRGTAVLFGTPEGKRFWANLTGAGRRRTPSGYRLLKPKHPWLAHLDPKQQHTWLNVANVVPVYATKGDVVIGSSNGLATLYRQRVGKGQLIYGGWRFASFLPSGRSVSTVEQETRYEEQFQILLAIMRDLYPDKADGD